MHRLTVLLVKAQNKEEAEKKAQYVLDNKICHRGSMSDDWGLVVSHEYARFLNS